MAAKAPAPWAAARARWVLGLAVVLLAVGAVYLPVVRIGPVAEDWQIVLKAARIAETPAELVHPFQGVWRPAAWAVFVPFASPQGVAWEWARALQLALGLAAAALGGVLARAIAGVPWPAALLVAALWATSPLASELFLGETALIGHGILAVSALALVLAWHAGRPLAAAAAAVVAAAAGEQWVVLPVLVGFGEVVLLRRPPGRALRSFLRWVPGLIVWAAAYGVVTHFAYRAVYRLDAAAASLKALGTAGAFFRLLPPAALAPGGMPREYLAGAAAGAALLAGVVAWALLRRRRECLFLLAASVLFLAPTAGALGQASRWTALPYLFFLAACAPLLVELWRLPTRGGMVRGTLRGALAVLAVVLLAVDTVTARADAADWREFAGLGRRAAEEAAPLVAAARAGTTLVVLRGADGAPLTRLLGSPRGQPKLYFPRPDDPYGAVSLQAVLSWELRPHGLAVERVRRPAAGAPVAAFVHDEGGFRELASVPAVTVRHPAGPIQGVGGVVLAPVAWSTFAPRAFP
jgi:hypothetical protein